MLSAVLFVVPSSAPQNFALTANHVTKLTMSWSRPPERDINGILTFYSVRYHIVATDNYTFKTADGRSHTFTLEQLSNYTEYEVLIAAATVNGTGPFDRKTKQTRENGR